MPKNTKFHPTVKILSNNYYHNGKHGPKVECNMLQIILKWNLNLIKPNECIRKEYWWQNNNENTFDSLELILLIFYVKRIIQTFVIKILDFFLDKWLQSKMFAEAFF